MDASTSFISSETLVRLGFFVAIFFVMALSEKIAPRRMLSKPKTKRWISNLGMEIIDVVLLRLIFPVFPVGIAVICVQRGWGLLNYYQIASLPALIIRSCQIPMTFSRRSALRRRRAFWIGARRQNQRPCVDRNKPDLQNQHTVARR